jgi:hypothetical protein
MKPSTALRGLLPLVVSAFACSSILGIEDIHPGPKPGSETGGDSGSGGTTGGTPSTGGTSTTGGKGGTGGTAGSATGGKGGATTGGASGTAGGGGDGDSGGDGGTGGGTPGTVTGTVIDFWGHKLAAVPVEIGTELVTTNAQGVFTIADVAPRYDLQLVVHWTVGREESYGWRFEGLTRRDPTLQVWAGLPSRSGFMEFTPENADLTGDRTLTAVFGGPDGAPYYSDIGENGFNSTLDWRGAAQTSVTARALLWGVNAQTDLPTGYFAYNSGGTSLDEQQPATLMLDMADDPNIQSGNVTGTVTPLSSDGRSNAAYVRFANSNGSTAAIQLVDDGVGPDTFTYLVPSLPQGSIMVAASEGDPYDGPFAVAFKDNLAPGGSANLTIPAAPILIAPAAGATGVDADTMFRWSGGTGPYLISMIDQDFYTGCYIVTAQTQTNLPTFAGFSLNPGGEHHWQVAVHGTYDDVDAMTGPTGYLQPLTDNDVPIGPRRGDGTYSISTWYQMFVAP